MSGSGLSIRAYAEHRRRRGLKGGTPWAVQKALKAGRIGRNAAGKIDPEQADSEWERRTSPARRTTANRLSTPIPTGSIPTGDAQSGGVSFAQARAVRELYGARLARLEFEERDGQLVEVAQVKIETFRKARELRDRILAIPLRIATELAAEEDPKAVRRLLDQELRAALVGIPDG